MAQYMRRFSAWPGLAVLAAIEGTAVIDLQATTPTTGQRTGLTICVGEFQDMHFAVAVDTSGVVSTDVRPTEVSGSQDFLDYFGAFDPTIGDWGVSHGNGFADVAHRPFSRLMLAPVNLCSTQAMRFFRSLPLCTTATNVTPIVAVTGAMVAAGTEFRNASARVRTGTAFAFTATTPIATGIAGATVNGASAVTQVFNATVGWDWSTVARPDGGVGARAGDILVIGYNNAGAAAPVGEAGTYRVVSDPASGVAITLEKLDGTAFVFTAQSAVPWRLHVGSDADSAPVIQSGTPGPGGYPYAGAGGFRIPVRPLTNGTGAGTDGSWTAGTKVLPVTAVTGFTGNTWLPLSNLSGAVGASGLPFVAALSAPNVASSATVDAAYVTAIDATLSQSGALSKTNIIFASRKSSTIRAALKANALTASNTAFGRVAITAPELSTKTVSAAETMVAIGRDERVVFTWPGHQEVLNEAVRTSLKTADGSYVTDGKLDFPTDALLASVLSILPVQRNPGQEQAPIPELLAAVTNIQRGVSALTMDDYIRLKADGVCAIRNTDDGFFFQSGVTSSTTDGKTVISRRRIADFIQDSVSVAIGPYAKLPPTTQNKDDVMTVVDTFLATLMGKDGAEQVLDSYALDDKSGNNDTTRAANLHIVMGSCKTLGEMGTIVFAVQTGPTVDTAVSRL